ncbi:hypothetical protein [Streptomyces caniscabiei]|nr:hypothetical protein [Streptomyces caniscabiei]MDX3725828.1 hypothetical protein [Streptomyces caniscabiei]
MAAYAGPAGHAVEKLKARHYTVVLLGFVVSMALVTSHGSMF